MGISGVAAARIGRGVRLGCEQQRALWQENCWELTQLSLRHYVAPSTNTIVPFLHIVPSENDQERLIPMSPELVKILVEVQRRARRKPDRPLSSRYDPNDKTFSEMLPNLFARLVGPIQNILSYDHLRKLLVRSASHARATVDHL